VAEIKDTMQKLFFSFLILLTANFAFAQTGRISGTILDSKTGETLPGATAMIEGTSKGASADFDGKFVINNVALGKVTLVINYISYNPKKITGIEVKAGEPIDINVLLDASTSQDLTEVEVVVTLNKENNTALVLQQKNNASVSDGISAETIKRSPDKNTSDVLKRVSGASIQDNKFAVIRGLNDRYNAAYLNGAPLPSTESDRKAFSFDIFPSNMLDNLVIIKTARPDLPGEFAGGIIEINTKNIPEKNFISASMGAGYNTITNGKDQIYYKGGKTDWLGLDDGTRALSKDMPSFTDFPVDIHEQAKLAKSLPVSDWSKYNKKFQPNSSFQISGGYNFKRKEKDFFGILGSVTYNNTNNYYTTSRTTYQSGRPNDPTDPLLLDKLYYDATYQTQKLVGALLNMSCKINDNNSISFKNLYSISSDDKTITRGGTTTPNELHPNEINATAYWFTQNIITTSQLIGDHFVKKAKLKINWNGGYSQIKREVPNLRRHFYSRETFLENKQTDPSEPPIYDPTDTIFKAQFGSPKSNSSDYAGVSLWTILNEKVYSAKLDASRIFKLNPNFTLEGKLGGFYQTRNRTFDFRQFIYSPYNILGGTTSFSSTIQYLPENQIFSQQNMGLLQEGTAGNNNIGGFVIGESTYPDSPYSAEAKLIAGYGMLDLKFKSSWRLITGARYESYYQRISYNDGLFVINNKVNTVDTVVNDILPSANLIYSPTEKINVRGSYSRTLNRPEFRELAPFLFFDFNSGFSLNGDPYLERATIDNYDLRFEWFPNGGQLVSVSGFYKHFINPIEMFKGQGTYQVVYGNTPSAYAQGVELEYRINIGNFYKNDSSTLGKILNNTTVFSNLALIQSQVDAKAPKNPLLAGSVSNYNRPLQGQSPYLFNAGISYVDNEYNFSFSAMLNRVGPRIYIVGNNIYQEIWEYSRTVMDLQATKSFYKNRLEFRFNVKDLFANNQNLQYYQNFDDKPFKKNSGKNTLMWDTRLGVTFSGQISFKF
jgi:outer membrane receptor protein involved in Fe transport